MKLRCNLISPFKMPATLFATKWRALAARIDGFRTALDVFLKARALPGIGPNLGGNRLICTLRDIAADIQRFSTDHEADLPPQAVAALTRFHRFGWTIVDDLQQQNYGSFEPERLLTSNVSIIAMKAEVDYLLARSDVALKSQAEKAFRHLQRLIAVDTAILSSWEIAARQGETACERLGSVHLLWHGIFAFKISTTGEQTDLMFGQSVEA